MRLHLAGNIREKKRIELERGDLSNDETSSRSIFSQRLGSAGSGFRQVEVADILIASQNQSESLVPANAELYVDCSYVDKKSGEVIETIILL